MKSTADGGNEDQASTAGSKEIVTILYKPGHRLFQVAFRANVKKEPLTKLWVALEKRGINILSSSLSNVHEGDGMWNIFLDCGDRSVTPRELRTLLDQLALAHDLKIVGGDEFIADDLFFPIVTTAGDRVLLFGQEALQKMLGAVTEEFGSGGRVISYQQGLALGSLAAGKIRKSMNVGLQGLAREAIKAYSANGVGRAEFLSADFEGYHFVITISHNIECEGKRTSAPNSDWIRGHLCGAVSTVLGVANYNAGSKVVVHPLLSDGTCAYCLQGKPNLCISRGFIGVATDGGYAEYVSVPASSIIPTGGMDVKRAAAMPVDFGTAWCGLEKAQVGPGDTVLVWGGAGGLGHAAIQISKLLGARVVAAVGDDSKRHFVESLGAESVNYRTEDLVASVRSLTDGLGASVVFDHIGGDTWPRSVECLARGGRMLALGLASGPKSELDVRRIYADELSIIGVYGQSRASLETVLGLAAQGKLSPSIQGELPLASAREAHEIIESRAVLGKMLLIP